MVARKPLVFASSAVKDGDAGLRFLTSLGGKAVPGFLIRYRGLPYAYVNRCAHLPTELDAEHGRFFDSTGSYLVCSQHGALFSPSTGQCVSGPCIYRHLQRLHVSEFNGQINVMIDSELPTEG